MEFTVTITEALTKAIVVNAENAEDAERLVRDRYRNGDITLGGDDFDSVDFDTAESESGTAPDYDAIKEKAEAEVELIRSRLAKCSKCFWHFVGDIGESTGGHFCGSGKDGRMTYGQDATEISKVEHCPCGNW